MGKNSYVYLGPWQGDALLPTLFNLELEKFIQNENQWDDVVIDEETALSHADGLIHDIREYTIRH